MPRREVAAGVRIVYDMLDWLRETDDFDTLMCIQEWVNDNFYLTNYKIIGVGDDAEIDEGRLEWQ